MSRLILTNANVLDGDSPSAPNLTIVIDGDRISSVGREPPDHGEGVTVDLRGRTVMPGMSTCHYHSTYPSGMQRAWAPYGYEYPPGYQALIAHRNLLTALQHGYTIAVGAGAANDIDPAMKQAIDDGFVLGPRFTPSGRELSTTGHANDLLAPWYFHLPSLGAARTCDGPEGFRLAVREEVKKGVKVIKLFVTRGHLVPGQNSMMEMTQQEMAAAIETAHERQIMIRGHLTGKRAILMAIELGIDVIDHCDEMDDEVIAAAVDTGTFVVPSIHYIELACAHAKSQGRQQEADALKQQLEFMYDALPKAEAAGVRLLLGDDYGGVHLRHGDYGGELHTYVDGVGLSPISVIRWATRHGAELIGRGDDLGTIEAGKVADLLIVEGDPSVDIGVLADKEPMAVLKDGKIVSGELPG